MSAGLDESRRRADPAQPYGSVAAEVAGCACERQRRVSERM